LQKARLLFGGRAAANVKETIKRIRPYYITTSI